MRRYVAEFIGTTFLLAIIIGSGIVGQRLGGLALLVSAIATGTGLAALIAMFAHVSGAHFNPLVTLSEAAAARLPWKTVPGYLVAQGAGAISGVVTAHLMFGLPATGMSHHARSSTPEGVSEAVATLGLLLLIRSTKGVPSVAVGLYVAAAYLFTASTGFMNPFATIARSYTNSFAGVAQASLLSMVVAQVVGAIFAAGIGHWLFDREEKP